MEVHLVQWGHIANKDGIFLNSGGYSRPFRWRSLVILTLALKSVQRGVEVDIVGGEIKDPWQSSWIIAVGRERKGAFVIALWWDNGMGLQ